MDVRFGAELTPCPIYVQALDDPAAPRRAIETSAYIIQLLNLFSTAVARLL